MTEEVFLEAYTELNGKSHDAELGDYTIQAVPLGEAAFQLVIDSEIGAGSVIKALDSEGYFHVNVGDNPRLVKFMG